MKVITRISVIIFITLNISLIGRLNAQNSSVSITKDAKIDELLTRKSEQNKDDSASKKYKIQIYSGTNTGANTKLNAYNNKFTEWSSKLVFETPNHKVWVGNFRTRLEADRALVEIKKEFDRAFIFKPKKKKKQ